MSAYLGQWKIIFTCIFLHSIHVYFMDNSCMSIYLYFSPFYSCINLNCILWSPGSGVDPRLCKRKKPTAAVHLQGDCPVIHKIFNDFNLLWKPILWYISKVLNIAIWTFHFYIKNVLWLFASANLESYEQWEITTTIPPDWQWVKWNSLSQYK